jgi:KDO2-lipid IV(A) lauroyltransferase
MRAVRWLKRGVPLHFSPDMDLGARESVFAPFFGVQAATVASMVRIARLTGAVIVPLVTRLTPAGYQASFYPAWTHSADDQQETLEAGVRRMNAFIEDRILEMPEQYLWTHRRFKTRPLGQGSVYG